MQENDSTPLSSTDTLIGEVAEIILKELDKSDDGRLKKTDLDKILLEEYREHNFSDRDFAFGINNTGTQRYFYLASFAGTTLEYAGYISRKKRGLWEITEEGKKASEKENLDVDLGEKFFERKKQARGKRTRNRSGHEIIPDERKIENNERRFDSDDIRSQIYDYIQKIDPYDFQELVAYLFEGMGYVVSYVAERGPDGGVDIVAHKDPIGIQEIIKIQVKHAQDMNTAGISMSEVRSLRDLCRDGSRGVIVSVKGFTRDTEKQTRIDQGTPIALIDCVRFVDLWIDHIDTIPEEGKEMLPLRKEYILDTQYDMEDVINAEIQKERRK